MRAADVCVIGGGVIGRCVALALVARGVRVDVVSRELPGAASRAAAGLLAPSIEGGAGAAHEFAIAARDHYPAFLEELRSHTTGEIEFSRDGILDVATDDDSEQRLRQRAASLNMAFLSPNEVAELEPELARARGGVLAPLDGYVDNVTLMDALEHATRGAGARLREISAVVSRVQLQRDSATLVLAHGERLACAAIALTAGARCAELPGLPRPLAVRPLKGQMIRYAAPATKLKRAVYGAGVYIVPRARANVLVGATSEEAGFDVELTAEAAHGLARGAKALVPALRDRQWVEQWSGLRPMTPDGLPVLGTDPEFASLIYACGHSRNGILKAPLTGECVAALFLGDPPRHDLTPFTPARFDAPSRTSPDD